MMHRMGCSRFQAPRIAVLGVALGLACVSVGEGLASAQDGLALGGGRRGRLREWLRSRQQGKAHSQPRLQEAPSAPWQTVEIGEPRLVKRITVLVDRIGGRVDWSHALNRIVFSQRGQDGYADIYTMRPDGTEQRCLTCDHPGVPQWSNDQPEWHPSGTYLVFQAQDPGLGELPAYLAQGGAGLNNNVWASTPDGSRARPLTAVHRGEASLHAHFSHDGRQLFWAARVVTGSRPGQGTWVLKLADVVEEGGLPTLVRERTLTPLARESFGFYESHGFTRDDSALIFSASPRAPEFDLDIYVMGLATEEVRNLTESPNEWDEHAILSPRGTTLVWISSHGYAFRPQKQWGAILKTDYWMMNVDGSQKRRLTFFNEPGSPEYTGERIIAADLAWNASGDQLVGVLGVSDGSRRGSRIVRIDLRHPVE